MIEDRPDSRLFLELGGRCLAGGLGLRFRARGDSMQPAIRDGEVLHITSVQADKLKKGDIVLFTDGNNVRAHRLIAADHDRDVYVTRGDAGEQCDDAIDSRQVIGKVFAKEEWVDHHHGVRLVPLCGARARARQFGWKARRMASQIVLMGRSWRSAIVLAFLLLSASSLLAQVAVDTTTSTASRITGAAPTVTFAHTTAGANRLLVVGVSINLTSSPTTTVSSVTYNGIAMSLAGAHNDAGNTRRVEMWTQLAPATGTHNVVVTFSGPGAGITVGQVTGATTFTGVDQTVPTATFMSTDGVAGTFSALDVSSVVNGMIIDTLAVSGNLTVTIGNSQVQQWNRNSGANTAQDVRGTASTRAGAPSVPLSETFNLASNWSLGALSLNPSQADVAVTATGSSAFFPQNLTYSISVKNNGPSPATGVTLTDTVAAGLVVVSAIPSQGTCIVGSPITCNIGTINPGVSVSIIVTVTPTATGGYANTATVTATSADLNTGNNSAVSVAFSQSNACSNPSSNGPGGTLTGIINTYYPGNATTAAGSKSITLGTATGATTPIAIGDLLLVIQMQDAAINSSNTSAYGDGATGSGFTNPNSTGLFEFVTATNTVPLTGGTLNLNATGAGGGLLYTYTNAAATGTQGQRKFQVVRVPQYSTATLSSGLTARAWNGSTGGILAMDVAGALALGSATVNLDGLGFRGGAGMQLNGGAGNNTDYRVTAPTTYTGGSAPGDDAPKGEGIAGTPRWVQSGGTFLNTGAEGYPNGSMARGAPGNAGGGGTDGDPVANDQNAGGGGGGNGGSGGSGGDSWNSNLSSGGLGGASFPASITRVVLGGGGGGGSRNNSDGDAQASSGAAGGGLVFIRAGALTGTATISANGTAAYNGTANDAGGGGGAGGSIVVLSFTGGEGGLTLAAHGGRGGDAWDSQPFSLGERHGPGGGGAGGVVLVSAAPASIDVSGGANGITLNPGVPYGATPGTAGVSNTSVAVLSLPGDQSGAVCTPDLTISKSHVGNFTRGASGTYTLTVSNISPNASTTGLVTVTDTLPTGLTPTAASGTGWSCGISAQTVTCTRSDALAANASYPAITVTVSVAQTAPNQVTNTASVAGGGEQNTTNDTASDVTNIGDSSDVAITKTGSPNPVLQGANFTYMLTVTNNGPTNATNVTTTDALPSGVTYVSATPSQGTCSQSAGTVTCNFGTLTSGSSATVSIVVTAGVPAVVTNTASVTADQPDPNSANNSASQTEIITFPTHVNLQTFTATSSGSQVLLSWKTGAETHNVGFNVYREVNGLRVRLNPSVIAGSALTFRASLQQQAARTYAWIDHSPAAATPLYWLEDLDLDGTRTLHGPASPQSNAQPGTAATIAASRMIAQLNTVTSTSDAETWSSHAVEATSTSDSNRDRRRDVQFRLAAQVAVKIAVKHAGWYRVTQPELVAAGLDGFADPDRLRLFAEGVEQPIRITEATSGRGGFGPSAAIEFYGTGIDTPYTNKRIYWLIADSTPGKRIREYTVHGDGGAQPQSFSRTVELKQRTTYFAALLRSGTDNFFGALVTTTAVDQVLNLSNISSTAPVEATVKVVLQGVTDGAHDVAVALNGSNLGNISLNSQEEGSMSWQVPLSRLTEGANTVTLTAENGENDLSLVDYITITYPHTYTAESNSLTFTGNAGDHIVVHGFQNAPAYLLDISNPMDPIKLGFEAEEVNGSWVLDAKLPWAPSGPHTLLALAQDRISTPVGEVSNRPSTWHAPQSGADVVMIANGDFIPKLSPLVRLRQSQGKSVAVVNVEDLYDEYTFGERTVVALREFLRSSSRWQNKPKYVLLVGDASVDPRDYLEFGFFDFVPTQIIPTSELKTASDDWFTDFQDTGFAQIPTGRLPARTADDLATMVNKIVNYERDNRPAPWTDQALMVADVDDPTISFTAEAQSVQSLLPPTMNITDVFATGIDPNIARQAVLDAINSGKLLVNYNGHGSIEIWSGEDLLDNASAASLTNGSSLPVFVIMNCLNGFFHDVYTESLAEALMLSKNGGAIAVWASSALTPDQPQLQMDQRLTKTLFSQNPPTLGDAIAVAKQSVTDSDVRKTFILFGDPAMRIKHAGALPIASGAQK